MGMWRAFAAGLVLAGAAFAARAESAPHPPPVCLEVSRIDHTHVVDPRTILFYMRGGAIWKNTLPAACPDLIFNGFAFATSIDEICSNMQSFRVLYSGEVCMLGTFTPYTPAAH